jgi:hypothetical protein
MQTHDTTLSSAETEAAKQQQQMMEASMDAFEALERQLQQQAQQRQSQAK